MTTQVADNGIIRVRSEHNAADTMRRLESAVAARGLTVFADVKFSEDAGRAGLTMRFTEMLIFGNPKAGTPVIVAAPDAALDLPLKVLVAEDSAGVVWLSCSDPSYLQKRHRIGSDLIQNISGVEPLMRAVAQ